LPQKSKVSQNFCFYPGRDSVFLWLSPEETPDFLKLFLKNALLMAFDRIHRIVINSALPY